MSKTYPPIQPFRTLRLNVSELHTIQIEEAGNPEGIPVLYLHGGPGGAIDPFARRLFNPKSYRIISFDQRGCGHSTPFLELQDNTTQALINDIERIRQHLHVDKWLVCGGSWGTTLALLYAVAFPHTVSGMVLRGIFLARQQDIDWYLAPDGAAAQVFPEHYQQLIDKLPGSISSKKLLEHYYSLLTGDNEIKRLAAAKVWTGWEACVAQMHFTQDLLQNENVHLQLSLAVMECHYMLNHCFIQEGNLLNNIHRIGDIPGIIVHGRYDMVCKAEAAYSLHQQWSNSELCIVPNAPHSGCHSLIASAFCRATDAMANFIHKQP